ncbi:hypothetical protein SK128_005108, partial [Halocaridina rubra]
TLVLQECNLYPEGVTFLCSDRGGFRADHQTNQSRARPPGHGGHRSSGVNTQ